MNFTNSIEDSPDNLIIIPEYFNFLIKTLDYNKIKKAIWWLSIDNYIGSRFRFKNSKLLRSIFKIPFNLIDNVNSFTNFYFGIYTIEEYLKLIYKFKDFNNLSELKQADFHLAQSNYACNYLRNKFDLVEYLSDFIRDDLLDNIDLSKNKKEDVICYNPQKSNRFMDLIIKKTNFKFITLINLDNRKIKEILLKSKIYMDIGSHPGKARLPREAALLGNCVITNFKGSALNYEDISILNEFKFRENNKNMNNRLKIRSNNNRYDNFKINFYNKVQKGFLKLSKNKKKYVLLDSNNSTPAENLNRIIKEFKKIAK